MCARARTSHTGNVKLTVRTRAATRFPRAKNTTNSNAATREMAALRADRARSFENIVSESKGETTRRPRESRAARREYEAGGRTGEWNLHIHRILTEQPSRRTYHGRTSSPWNIDKTGSRVYRRIRPDGVRIMTAARSGALVPATGEKSVGERSAKTTSVCAPATSEAPVKFAPRCRRMPACAAPRRAALAAMMRWSALKMQGIFSRSRAFPHAALPLVVYLFARTSVGERAARTQDRKEERERRRGREKYLFYS